VQLYAAINLCGMYADELLCVKILCVGEYLHEEFPVNDAVYGLAVGLKRKPIFLIFAKSEK
jgi:hypothetical protein